jgi:WD40 repeat protein
MRREFFAMRNKFIVRLSLVICTALIASAVGLFFLLRNRTPQLANAFAPQRPTAFAQNLGGVQWLLFSPDGKRLFVAGDSNRVTVYQTGSWKKLAQWRFKANQLFISRDGARLFTWEYSDGKNERSTFAMRDAADGKLLSSWQRESTPKASEFFSSISDDFSRVALQHSMQTGKNSWIRRLKIVDAATGKEHVSSSPIKDWFFRSVWLNDDKWLRLNETKAPLSLLQTSDLKPIPSLPKTNYATVTQDGSTLVGVRNSAPENPNGVVILHHLQTRRTQEIPMPQIRLQGAYLMSDALVISGYRKIQKSQSTEFIQIRTPDGAHIKSQFDCSMSKVGAHRKLLSTGASRASDGRFERYKIYRARDGKNIATLDADADVLGESGKTIRRFNINPTAFSPDGAWFVSGDENGLLRCWRLPTDDVAKP